MAKRKRKVIPGILSVSWTKREAEIGEKIALEAITQNANGLTATFQIYEYRKKNRIIKEIKVPIKEPKVTVFWKVEYVSDIYGEEPPEYRFKLSIGKTSRTSKTLYLKPEVVNIALTFDDGPHAAEFGNRTGKVLDVLKKQNIRAAFFIQTHAPLRAKTENGGKIVQRMAKEGHIVGIHTGSLEDHVDHALRVKQKPEDVNGDGRPDGKNGLESDLIRAKQLIKSLTGNNPKFVRAPYGRCKADKEILPTYKQQRLVHVFWDIDSLDNIKVAGRRRTPAEVRKALGHALDSSKLKEIIILFHDLNSFTSKSIEDYIRIIVEVIRKQKKVPKFTTHTRELLILLTKKGVK